jgi:nicotinamidase-related amidase
MFDIGGKQIPSTLAEIVDAKRTALLIWDMEYAIGPNAFNYQAILGNLKRLSAAARERGVPVFLFAANRLRSLQRRSRRLGASAHEASESRGPECASQRKRRSARPGDR